MRTRKAIVLALLLLPFAAGCSPSPGGAARAIEVSEASLHVYAGDSLLYDIRHVLPGRNGEMWVLSALEPFVYRFSTAGRIQARFGRQGKGPGELLNPWSLAPVPGTDGVGVWDVGRHGLTVYDRAGVLTASRQVPLRTGTVRGDIRQISYGEPYKLRAAAGGMVVQVPAGSVSQPADLYSSVLLRLRDDGTPGDTLISFRGMRAAAGLGQAQALVPVPLWTTCPGGEVVVFEAARQTVHRFPARGAARREQLRIPTRALGEDDIRPYLRRMLEQETREQNLAAPEIDRLVGTLLGSTREMFGARTPAAVDLLCDGDGSLWLNQFSTRDHPVGYGREWLVFRGTRLLRRVTFPAGFRAAHVEGNRVSGTFTDGDDVQHPAVATLPAR
ncbi:MAG TPA: hypothetical protein VFQ45_07820 [Longimicrobium sp.]|nr:hypothetical protein [Longimicrobium sp.]